MLTHLVREHCENPRNIGTITDANGTATVGSAAKGEMLKLTLNLADELIVAAKFRAFGCPAAIASGSILTEMIIGLPISDAQKITAAEVSEALGGLPSDKHHYAVYAEDVLKTAIADALACKK